MNKLINKLMFLLVWFLVVYFFLDPLDTERMETRHNLYYKSYFNSRIKYVDKRAGRFTRFIVEGDTAEYMVPLRHLSGDTKLEGFPKLAEPGDSVFKNKYSDTLMLIKNGTMHYFSSK